MYQIGNYIFESREMAKRAKKEDDGIKYLREHTNMEDPQVVLNLYQNLIQQNIMETPLGLGFLRELQLQLLAFPEIVSQDITPIPVKDISEEARQQARDQAHETMKQRRLQEEKDRLSLHKSYKKQFFVSTFFCIVFACALIGMFGIQLFSSNNVTILNYEENLVDKYELWDQQLEEKQEQLDQREEELEQREAKLQATQ